MIEHDQCENCKFWVKIEDNEGACRRHPPKVVNSGFGFIVAGNGFFFGDRDTKWPRTCFDDWCGEYLK